MQKVASFSKRGLRISLPEEKVIECLELKMDKLIVVKYLHTLSNTVVLGLTIHPARIS